MHGCDCSHVDTSKVIEVMDDKVMLRRLISKAMSKPHRPLLGHGRMKMNLAISPC